MKTTIHNPESVFDTRWHPMPKHCRKFGKSKQMLVGCTVPVNFIAVHTGLPTVPPRSKIERRRPTVLQDRRIAPLTKHFSPAVCLVLVIPPSKSAECANDGVNQLYVFLDAAGQVGSWRWDVTECWSNWRWVLFYRRT